MAWLDVADENEDCVWYVVFTGWQAPGPRSIMGGMNHLIKNIWLKCKYIEDN